MSSICQRGRDADIPLNLACLLEATGWTRCRLFWGTPAPSMTEADVVRIMRAHLEGLFPKVCPSCHRRFATLREYVLTTEHLGPAMPYDAELGDWAPLRQTGTLTYSNCPCGTTLALSSHGMSIYQLWPLLHWARLETKRRGLSPQELLNYLRDEICKQVLAEPGQGNS